MSIPRTLEELGPALEQLCKERGRVVVPYSRPSDRAYIWSDGSNDDGSVSETTDLHRVTFVTFAASAWTEAMVCNGLWHQVVAYIGSDKPAIYWRARPSLLERWSSGRDRMEEVVEIFDHAHFSGSLRIAASPRDEQAHIKAQGAAPFLDEHEYRRGVRVVASLKGDDYSRMSHLFNRKRRL